MNADPGVMITAFSRRLGDIKQSRSLLGAELSEIETSLSGCMSSIDAVQQRLKDKRNAPRAPQAPGTPAPGMSPDDFKAFIEKILQGSLEAAGDKISDRLAGMIRELKVLTGPEREAKIQQIKEAADSDMVDLSKLYMHEEVQSNLGEVGVEEKESKGIESSLEKLRELRGKPKPDQDAKT